MLKLLSLAILWFNSCAAGLRQAPREPARQIARAKPCEAATAQAGRDKCGGEEFLGADEHLHARARI
jgi:hypothetical protein